MTRDELLDDIVTEVRKVLPDNEELDGEDLDTIAETINECVVEACEALDSEENEEVAAEGEGDKKDE